MQTLDSQKSLVLLLLMTILLVITNNSVCESQQEQSTTSAYSTMDVNWLASTPYGINPKQRGGPELTLDQIMNANRGKPEFEIHDLSSHGSEDEMADVEHRYIGSKFESLYAGNTLLNGHFIRLNNPRNHFSIVQPAPGCDSENNVDSRTTVEQTANSLKYQKTNDPNYDVFNGKNVTCIYATNAGFFDVNNGHCLGNIVSNGRVVQQSVTTNVNLAISKKGKVMVGYVGGVDTANQALRQSTGDENDSIVNMVGGVIWLVREGESFVDGSLTKEYPDTQKSGSLQQFIDLRASRIALGHDDKGRIIIVEIDGDGNAKKGLTLYELADVLISLGVKNAINLDGGGSASVVQGFRTDDLDSHTTINDVSDGCGNRFKEEGNSFDPAYRSVKKESFYTSSIDEIFKCSRRVTTITCIHDSLNVTSRTAEQVALDFNKQFCSKEYDRLLQIGLLLAGSVSLLLFANLLFACVAFIFSRQNKKSYQQLQNPVLSDVSSSELLLSDDEDAVVIEPTPLVELKELKL